MKLLYRCCAGVDIHRDSVSAWVRRRVRRSAEATIEEEVFGTFTQELERLRGWLKKHKVRQVAMESTGVYWILQGRRIPDAKWKYPPFGGC
jgi:transposase